MTVPFRYCLCRVARSKAYRRLGKARDVQSHKANTGGLVKATVEPLHVQLTPLLPRFLMLKRLLIERDGNSQQQHLDR